MLAPDRFKTLTKATLGHTYEPTSPRPSCGPRGASLPRSAAYPEGEPYFTAAWPRVYQCANHKVKPQLKISLVEFNRLPELGLEDLDRLAKVYKVSRLADLATQDLEGAGFPKEHARDLFKAGLGTVADVEALSRE